MYAARYFGPRFYGRRFFGKTGVTVEGQHFGGRFFGGWYWGHRYFGPDSTNVLGTHFGGRYWGTRTWGRHYFGTKGTPGFIVAPTGPSLAGALTFGSAAFVYAAALPVAQSAALGLAATVGISGALSFDGDTDFSVTPPLDLPGLTGNLLLSGDLSITGDGPAGPGSYWGRRHWGGRFYGPRYWGRGAGFSLASSAGLSLTGSMGVAGGIATAVVVSPTSLVAATGVLTLGTAEFTFGVPDPLTPPPQTAGGGWPTKKPKKRYEYLSPPTREQMAERVRQQREALGILPAAAQKRIETAVKKEARRTDPDLAELAPVAAEVAQDTGVALGDVITAIERTFEHRLGLIEARIEADAAQRREAEAAAAEQGQQRQRLMSTVLRAAAVRAKPAADKEADPASSADEYLAHLRKDDEQILSAAQKQREKAAEVMRKLQQRLLKLLH